MAKYDKFVMIFLKIGEKYEDSTWRWWLQDLFANCAEKGLKCAELKVDLLIDDNQKFAQQVNAQGIRSIILSAPYNLKYKNILSTHASCWPEVYYIVQDLHVSLDEYRKAKLEKESKKIMKEIS